MSIRPFGTLAPKRTTRKQGGLAMAPACGHQSARGGMQMTKSIGAAVCAMALISAGGVAAQGMLLEFAADKVIKKYESATCEQLKVQKNEPRTEREKMAIDFLRHDSQARVAFIDKIAAPVLNKLFECDLIP